MPHEGKAIATPGQEKCLSLTIAPNALRLVGRRVAWCVAAVTKKKKAPAPPPKPKTPMISVKDHEAKVARLEAALATQTQWNQTRYKQVLKLRDECKNLRADCEQLQSALAQALHLVRAADTAK